MALGWPDLLTSLQEMIKENVQPSVNQSHLETIDQILSLSATPAQASTASVVK